MSDADSTVHRNVRRVIDAGAELGLEVTPHRFPEGTKTAVDAANAIGCDVAQIVKSLIFAVDGEVVLAYVSGVNQLDERKLGDRGGRCRVQRVDADLVREKTGFPIGGVPPIGHTTQLRVFIDPDLLQHDVVWAAAGTWHDVFPLSPADLELVSGGTVVDLKPREGEGMTAGSDREWLVGLPKVELHCHLEGSMSVDTVRALTERHGADPTPIWPDGFPAAFSFDGFPSFAKQFFYGLALLRTGDDLATITDDLAATLAAQNVRYAEITTTAFTHFLDRDDRRGMSWTDYRDGLDEGRRRAGARGVDIGWVIDIPRDLEMPDQTVTIEYLESDRTPDGLVAIGLGGYEVGFPAAPYAEHFAVGARSAWRRSPMPVRRRAPPAFARRSSCSTPFASATACGASRIRVSSSSSASARDHARGVPDQQRAAARRRFDRRSSAAGAARRRGYGCASTRTIPAGSRPIW